MWQMSKFINKRAITLISNLEKGYIQAGRMHAEVVIIGSGPAGHTAGIYSSRANRKTVMFEGSFTEEMMPGGQLMTTTDVENFPGFPTSISGSDLVDKMREQSERVGTQIIAESIVKADLSCKPIKLWRESADVAAECSDTCDALVIATGATAKKLDVINGKKYWQNGISACAICDGAAPIFKKKVVALVGGGDTACEEAVFLTKFCSKVLVVVRRDKFRASSIMANRVLKNPLIEVLWNSKVVEATGDGDLLQGIILADTVTGEKRSIQANGLFFAIGHKPNTDIFKDQIDLDSDGYIVPIKGTSKTNLPNVFAAGDVQDKHYRQAITAAASGCMAALDANMYLESLSD